MIRKDVTTTLRRVTRASLLLSALAFTPILDSCTSGNEGNQATSTPLMDTISSHMASVSKSHSCVLPDEYKSASPLLQRTIRYVDAAIAALTNLQKVKGAEPMCAIINVSADTTSFLGNLLTIGVVDARKEGEPPANTAQVSCHTSLLPTLQKILANEQGELTEASFELRLEGDVAHLAW